MFASARAMARRAASLGADAILVHPPVAFRDRDDRDLLILDYHAERSPRWACRWSYSISMKPREVSPIRRNCSRRLLRTPEVLGIKVATLDSVMTFQDIARLIRERGAR